MKINAFYILFCKEGSSAPLGFSAVLLGLQMGASFSERDLAYGPEPEDARVSGIGISNSGSLGGSSLVCAQSVMQKDVCHSV